MVNGLTIRAVHVSHIVPTTGFILEDKKGAIAFSSDTGPTERFWEMVNAVKKLRAVITETSFPNELQDLANISGHLTPQTPRPRAREARARRARLPLRRASRSTSPKVKKQVAALKRKNVRFFVQGRTYKF